MSDPIAPLKSAIASLWQMENELRYSAWSALSLDKQEAVKHLASARSHLNALLNAEDPKNFTPDQPPMTDP